MRKFLLSVLLTTLIVGSVVTIPASTALAAPQRDRVGHYTPPAGAKFNNPLGTPRQQRRLFKHVIRSIKSVPRKGVIRIAVFSFADQETAKALIAAYWRGVKVRLIFSGNNVYPPMKSVRRVIGTDTTKSSFVVMCQRSCRGTGGQMHAKYFSFSRAGKARRITMVGSNNLTNFNAERQWSDLYTVTNDEAYFNAFKPWFKQLKADLPAAKTYIRKTASNHQLAITPIDLAVNADPLLVAMSTIRCQVTQGEIDPGSPTPDTVVSTRVLISTHAWNGTRGVTLAQRVAELESAGCAVQVFYGPGDGFGDGVRTILTDAAVPMTSGTHKGYYTHQKLLIVDGAVDGELRTTRVLTGSQNWSTRALARDDIMVEIDDDAVAARYISAFDRMLRIG